MLLLSIIYIITNSDSHGSYLNAGLNGTNELVACETSVTVNRLMAVHYVIPANKNKDIKFEFYC